METETIELLMTASESVGTILGVVREAMEGSLDGSKRDEALFHLNNVANAWHDFSLCVSDLGPDEVD